jgi:hypothetical protein
VLNRPGVTTFFATHDWVASLDELAALGVSAAAVSRARRAGSVTTVAPRVVALSGADLGVRSRARAAVLAAGAEAFASGVTAGALLGLREMPRARTEVTILERRRINLPPWCRIVRTSWLDDDRDVQSIAGLRVATPLRMLFGLASQFNQHRFERCAEDVWHLGLVGPEDAARYLAVIRRSGRSGVIRMERWLERTAARAQPAQSGLELDLLAAIERVGLPAPVRQFALVVHSGEMIHLDIAWPDLRLAFEPGHSWWHGGDLRQRRDAVRDQACAEAGWAVHRFDEVQVADRPDLERRIVAIYRRRADLIHRARSPERS